MNTILVLTDFSDVSFHAAEYACALSRQLNSKRIVLYHAYEFIMPSSPSAITGQLDYTILEDTYNLENNRSLRENSLQRLEEVKNSLTVLVDNDTVIECAAENTRLVDGINDVGEEFETYLVVAGISGKEGLEAILGGNNAVEVADQSRYPVLIVPMQAPVEPIKRIVFASDLENIKDKVPGKNLQKLLDDFKAALMVVHVDKERPQWVTETQGPGGMPELYRLLEAYHPSFDFIGNEDIVAGITEYAEQHKASLILAIGRSHGFFKSLFHRSLSHKLAYHSPIPLLFIHEAK
jgi:nucleotide-binding universal stress UspA family protein